MAENTDVEITKFEKKVPEMLPEVLPAEEARAPSRVIVVARDADQMGLAQKQLISWMDQKIAAEKSELEIVSKNLETAKKNKWGTQALKRAHDRQAKRVTYYEKLKLALDAGYTIIPNFPQFGFEIFAIRTKKQKPTYQQSVSRYSSPSLRDLSGDVLSAGVGRYVSPVPHTQTWSDTEKNKDGKDETIHYIETADEFRDVEFPFQFAKQEIMEDTKKAMELGIFDDICVAPRQRRNADPMIIGRVHLKGNGGGGGKIVSFLITWFVDTNDL